jgi:ribosomal protein S18 acetylase RimI-like enzyme
MLDPKIAIRKAEPSEYAALGQLMISVYSQLDGFPTIDEQPAYYDMLANVGDLTKKPETHLIVAVSIDNELFGGVVYFGDMQSYGSGGTATQVTNASGIRLLAVDPAQTGKGIGRALTEACMQMAKDSGNDQVVLHTTEVMEIAWGLYERMGFKRSPDLDFMQQELPVFGFRLELS